MHKSLLGRIKVTVCDILYYLFNFELKDPKSVNLFSNTKSTKVVSSSLEKFFARVLIVDIVS